MTAKPLVGWLACARCVNGNADGTQCRAPQLRSHLHVSQAHADQVRVAGQGLCGPNAAWHVYQPAAQPAVERAAA